MSGEKAVHVDKPSNPASILQALWTAWRYRDKAGILELMSDDVVYAIYVPNHVLPFAGETAGKPAMADRLQSMIEQFECLEFTGAIGRVDGDTARGQVSYRFRHRITGQVSDGTMRQVILVRDGLIAELRTYKDAERVRAFMQLVAHSAADDTIPHQ